MKKLVIHPKDETTNFLSEIYSDTDCTVITNIQISSKKLKEAIKEHDIILMCGHGSEHGLFALNDRMIIDSKLVYLLRDKICICIWCNADKFVEKYGLKGIYTGMIISEYDEAKYCKIDTTDEAIEQSNVLFAQSFKKNVFDLNITEILLRYNCLVDNPIIAFNKERIYFRAVNNIS